MYRGRQIDGVSVSFFWGILEKSQTEFWCLFMEKYGLPLAQYTENVSFKHIHPNCPLSAAKYEPKHSGVQGT